MAQSYFGASDETARKGAIPSATTVVRAREKLWDKAANGLDSFLNKRPIDAFLLALISTAEQSQRAQSMVLTLPTG
jgi:hypothetical protein